MTFCRRYRHDSPNLCGGKHNAKKGRMQCKQSGRQPLTFNFWWGTSVDCFSAAQCRLHDMVDRHVHLGPDVPSVNSMLACPLQGGPKNALPAFKTRLSPSHLQGQLTRS